MIYDYKYFVFSIKFYDNNRIIYRIMDMSGHIYDKIVILIISLNHPNIEIYSYYLNIYLPIYLK